ncbi:MAG: class I SAM-dependent methyltransferase [archaeon]|nr:MAG: class I SAM-dependent methyltransferase [archaeon]
MNKREWDKVTKNYYEEILSPIKNLTKNPLFVDLRKIKNKDSKEIIDLGCGRGELSRVLGKSFKKVTAVDFSREMIKIARKNNTRPKKVSFIMKDISNLPEFHNKFDIALSINSIISTDVRKINRIIEETYNVLKKKGKLLCLLSAMEVYLYQSLLKAGKEKSRDQTKRKIRSLEIIRSFKEVGFKKIKVKKVLYPKKEFREACQGCPPNKDLPWDWYVSCEK